MTDNLFHLNYSDALKEEIRNIKNPKVRKVFMNYFKQMEKDIEEHPEDYSLTFGEFLFAKIISWTTLSCNKILFFKVKTWTLKFISLCSGFFIFWKILMVKSVFDENILFSRSGHFLCKFYWQILATML